jgi:uncharacterized repeat protein (TIGR03803 family)
VFSVTPDGTKKIIYTFKGGSDGAYPRAGLVEAGGKFYGTTYAMGQYSRGTVFQVTAAGVENIVYAFKGGSDGSRPEAAMINVLGTLYGTASADGTETCSAGCGTVFSVTPGGTEKTIYAFKGGSDGDEPFASLIYLGGVFYSTTVGGGTNRCSCGTVFSVTSGGTEHVLYSFKYNPDGAFPRSNLIYVNRALYGTTNAGGSNSVGTVFSISK